MIKFTDTQWGKLKAKGYVYEIAFKDTATGRTYDSLPFKDLIDIAPYLRDNPTYKINEIIRPERYN